MAEQLQHLIERIQRDAVEKAEREAARITADAEERAADLIRKAQEKAEAIAPLCRRNQCLPAVACEYCAKDSLRTD